MCRANQPLRRLSLKRHQPHGVSRGFWLAGRDFPASSFRLGTLCEFPYSNSFGSNQPHGVSLQVVV